MKAVIRRIGGSDFAKLGFFLLVLITVAALIALTPDLVPSTLLSLLLFFVFAPIINAMERRGVDRGAAITSVFLVCGAVLFTSISSFAPRVTQEIESFRSGRDRYGAELKNRLLAREHAITEDLPFLAGSNLTEQSLSWLRSSSGKMLEALPNLASQLLMALFMVPFITFILLKEGPAIRRSLLSLVPNRYFETVYSLLSRIMHEMGGYVAARIIEAVLVAAMVTITCIIFKIPYAVLLGFFAGATNAIPYLGPVIGAAPGLLFALLDPQVPNQMLYVSLIYVVANVVDMALIFPLVVAKIVNLHPLVVVLSVIVGSKLFGILGMILAVPITSILKIFMQELYTRVYAHNHRLS